jgi:two-component system LytT family sensor kinase
VEKLLHILTEKTENLFDYIARLINRVPRVWRRAYLFICLWYAFHFIISSIIEWRMFSPHTTSPLWTGLYMFEALCIAVIFVFLYADSLFRMRLEVQIAGHINGLIIYFLGMSYLYFYLDYYLDGFVYFDDWKEYMYELLSWDAMRYYDQYIITVAVYYIIRYFESLQKKEQEKGVLALKNKEMQLSLLKSQINPHFLFNTLNSISTLIGSNKVKARKVISQMSDIFRYALDANTEKKVKLIHEIEFIENYIKIQQVRFPERLMFIKDVESTCLSLDFPPMILQPIIENSVKYGIAPKDEGGTIKLIIQRNGKGIYFEVSDDGLGINAKKVLDSHASSGIGLKNSDKRLRSIYGKSAKLHIEPRLDGYKVSFTIPESETIDLKPEPVEVS